jgi:hypothetical protein
MKAGQDNHLFSQQLLDLPEVRHAFSETEE